jgi:hypothetical protein
LPSACAQSIVRNGILLVRLLLAMLWLPLSTPNFILPYTTILQFRGNSTSKASLSQLDKYTVYVLRRDGNIVLEIAKKDNKTGQKRSTASDRL